MTQLELLPTTQTAAILSHLKGAPITPLEALRLYGCLRLSGRVLELREQGYDIRTKMVDVGHGKRVAEYSLVAEQPRSVW